MKLANSVHISVFSKSDDVEEVVKAVLIELFPFDLEKEKIKLSRQKSEGFQDKHIIIFEVVLGKDRHMNAFLDSLALKLSKDQKELLLKQENRLDDHLNFFIRLDKKALIDGVFHLTDTGECFHIKINIAAFPRKKDLAWTVIRSIFSI